MGLTRCACLIQLLEGRPRLELDDRRALDRHISLPELSEAVQPLSKGCSPGIDRLPAEFYQGSWVLLGKDNYEMLEECFRRGKDNHERLGECFRRGKLLISSQ